MTDETVPETAEPTAPVEQAPAAPEAPAEVTAVTPDDARVEPEEKPKGGFQRRIKELSDDRNYWRELALRQTAPEQPKPEAKPVEPAKPPKLEDFNFDEGQYQAAFLQYATQQAELAVERRLAERDRQAAEQHRASTFEERVAAFAKVKPDFAERAFDPTLPITAAMRDVITDSESGPEIAYWLAENREQAAKIANLPPHLAALELGRIEGRLQAQKEAAARPKPVPSVTQTPPPPPVVDETEAIIEKSPDDMSMNEWLKWRNKQIAKNAQAWAKR